MGGGLQLLQSDPLPWLSDPTPDPEYAVDDTDSDRGSYTVDTSALLVKAASAGPRPGVFRGGAARVQPPDPPRNHAGPRAIYERIRASSLAQPSPLLHSPSRPLSPDSPLR